MTDYTIVAVDDLPDAPSPAKHKKEVDEAVGATEFGFNVYEADPGEELPLGYHYHPNHQELFYVIKGELAFETPEEEFRVGSGEVFFVSAGAPQKGRAVGEESARVVATGAPKQSDEAIVTEYCSTCDEVTEREYSKIEEGDEATIILTCATCGAETDRFHS